MCVVCVHDVDILLDKADETALFVRCTHIGESATNWAQRQWGLLIRTNGPDGGLQREEKKIYRDLTLKKGSKSETPRVTPRIRKKIGQKCSLSLSQEPPLTCIAFSASLARYRGLMLRYPMEKSQALSPSVVVSVCCPPRRRSISHRQFNVWIGG